MLKFQEELERESQIKNVFMEIAVKFGSLSRCNRRKVGALIVLPDNSIVYGYNGTPKGTCNSCEENNITKPEVIHAEMNAIFKATKSLKGSTLYVTIQPCISCAAALVQKGINKVYYKDKYHNDDGVSYLKKYGITVQQL